MKGIQPMVEFNNPAHRHQGICFISLIRTYLAGQGGHASRFPDSVPNTTATFADVAGLPVKRTDIDLGCPLALLISLIIQLLYIFQFN